MLNHENRVSITAEDFLPYSCAVIVLHNMVLCGSSFPAVSFRKQVFVFLCFLSIKTLKYAPSCYVILLCNFVLTLYKNSRLINYKLFINVLQYHVKIWFQRCFEFFQKIEKTHKKKCGTVKK